MNDVLVFVGSLAVGGTERHLSQVLPELARRGWKVEVAVSTDGGAFAAPIRAAGIPIEVLPRGSSLPVAKVRGAITLIQQASALALRLRSRPPRILHCFLPTCCIIGGVASRIAGFSPVVMSRRSQAVRPSSFPGDKQFERWALRRANLVFGHSKPVIEELKSEGIAERRLRLNHNGIDLKIFDASSGDRGLTRRINHWHSNEIVFAAVANLIPYKGHVDLLHAFGRLQDKRPPWRLILVGEGEAAFTEHLQHLARQLRITEQVSFLGPRENVPQLLKAADVGILASHQEGFPNAILEYMAAGLPVIATTVGGNVDAVAEGETGLLVPARTPDALAQAAASLLNNPALRERLGQSGRRRVEAMFSLDACVARYEEVYRSLMDEKKVRMSV